MNKPCADMTELERCRMMAEFCGLNFCGTNSEISPVILRNGMIEPWNPFKDANALEVVEAAIVRVTKALTIRQNEAPDPVFKFQVWIPSHSCSVHCFFGDTKADALHAVVVALVERKG